MTFDAHDGGDGRDAWFTDFHPLTGLTLAVVLSLATVPVAADAATLTAVDTVNVGGATSADPSVAAESGDRIAIDAVAATPPATQADNACLLRGTLVRTPRGEVPVEALAIGDEVVTLDGTIERLKWIGRRAYAPVVAKLNPRIVPIRIAAGALGEGLPTSDLLVSPVHALYLDGVLVPATLLVNGDTIRPAPEIGTVEYFHLELDAPDVLWTNGAPTESYVNHDNRRMFANWTQYVALYGAEDVAPRGGDGQFVRRFKCVYGGPILQAIRARLAGYVAPTLAA
ncbi:MAG TPA: Hint domain-containing protein [Vineibacter sp.]|nr:Hint domain-containing protein [Vineibacter sp.]